MNDKQWHSESEEFLKIVWQALCCSSKYSGQHLVASLRSHMTVSSQWSLSGSDIWHFQAWSLMTSSVYYSMAISCVSGWKGDPSPGNPGNDGLMMVESPWDWSSNEFHLRLFYKKKETSAIFEKLFILILFL